MWARRSLRPHVRARRLLIRVWRRAAANDDPKMPATQPEPVTWVRPAAEAARIGARTAVAKGDGVSSNGALVNPRHFGPLRRSPIWPRQYGLMVGGLLEGQRSRVAAGEGRLTLHDQPPQDPAKPRGAYCVPALPQAPAYEEGEGPPRADSDRSRRALRLLRLGRGGLPEIREARYMSAGRRM